MRQLGTLKDERSARAFQDYLLTKGISVAIDGGPEDWQVWVRNEDHLDAARREFDAFVLSPDAPIYRTARDEANRLRAIEEKRVKTAKKNLVNVGDHWRAPLSSRAAITMLLTAASIGVAVFSNLGSDQAIVTSLSIVPYEIIPPQIEYPLLRHVWYQEPWRLVTPIFLHFGLPHIIFNMIMLLQLGRPIEAARGWWRFALLVVLIAVPSNIAQYCYHGPQFGGMSGVIYGLFGYVWMKSRYEPSSGFYIPSNTVVWMIGWFFLCLTGIVGPVANVVHGVGLVVGMLLGRMRSLIRTLR
jgi:GlpG protein